MSAFGESERPRIGRLEPAPAASGETDLSRSRDDVDAGLVGERSGPVVEIRGKGRIIGFAIEAVARTGQRSHARDHELRSYAAFARQCLTWPDHERASSS